MLLACRRGRLLPVRIAIDATIGVAVRLAVQGSIRAIVNSIRSTVDAGGVSIGSSVTIKRCAPVPSLDRVCRERF